MGNASRSMFSVLLIFYIAIYSIFLHSADYLPYVFDNNETYSSLVHAYNMYFGDWSKHFGLTDEAFSLDPSAHPMIHTHQGNWPRILSLMYFMLGARGPESQIIIHVFTLGSVSVWLMYRYFIKVSHSSFAFIATMVFITDYILFAQWQVVTYRIWHTFFVFAVLNCMHELDNGDKRWKLFTIFNFIALYYWELVFAFYLSIWALIYYSFICNWNVKKIFRVFLLIAGSGALSLCVLFLQLCLFMGYKNVFKDFYLTFFARNFSTDPYATQKILSDFYDNKNIVFIYNISNGELYKTIKDFVSSFFEFGFKVHTPILSLLSILSLVAIYLTTFKLWIYSTYKNCKNLRLNMFLVASVIAFPLTILLFEIKFYNSILGLDNSVEYEFTSLSHIFMSVISYALSYLICSYSSSYEKKIPLLNACLAFIFLSLSLVFIRLQPSLYQQEFSIIWFDSLSKNVPTYLWRCLVVFIICTCTIFQLRNQDISKYIYEIRGVKVFLFSAFAAYLIVYALSPGYIYSGYLHRFAPFIVYIIDVVIALFVWTIFKLMLSSWRILQTQSLNAPTTCYSIKNNLLVILANYGFAILNAGLFCVVLFFWFYTQYQYLNIFPPNTLAFIKYFRAADLHGKTIVSNQYTTPLAYETQNWAYIDPQFAVRKPVLTMDGLDPGINYEYLWYKNKKKSDQYKFPDVFVCFTLNSFSVASAELRNPGKQRWCSNNGTVQSVISERKNKKYFKHKVKFTDVAKDRWAIIETDWKS